MGTILWTGFPAANRSSIRPCKEFIVHKDSVMVRAPYKNGRLWYEGMFSTKRGLGHGAHTVYDMKGFKKGTIDYDRMILIKYDSTGRIIDSSRIWLD